MPDPSPTKEPFLQRVREALGRTEPLLYAPDYPPLKTATIRQEEKVRTIQAKAFARRDRLVERLKETASTAGWHVHHVHSPEDAADVLGDIAIGIGAKAVVRTAEDIFKAVNVDAVLRRARITSTILASGRSRPRSSLKRTAFGADLGVSGVAYAIAETASCAIVPRKGIARLTSLAPPVYAAVVVADQVLESLDDYFAVTRLAYQRGRGRTPNYANFISGPSRTADIEQTLTIGVHGPGIVHMVVVD